MAKDIVDPLKKIAEELDEAVIAVKRQANSQAKMTEAAIALRDVVREQAAVMAEIAARMEATTRKAQEMARLASRLARKPESVTVVIPSLTSEQERQMEEAILSLAQDPPPMARN